MVEEGNVPVVSFEVRSTPLSSAKPLLNLGYRARAERGSVVLVRIHKVDEEEEGGVGSTDKIHCVLRDDVGRICRAVGSIVYVLQHFDRLMSQIGAAKGFPSGESSRTVVDVTESFG